MYQSVEVRENVSICDPITFKVGSHRLYGMLHVPQRVEPVPGVLICHGLAGDKLGRYRAYVEIARALVTKGIAVLRFDFRGCGDSEGLFSDFTLDSHIEDALAALDVIKNHPDIDTTRLGIYGRSFGGLTAILAAEQCKSFKSICLWAPVFNGDPWADLWKQLQSGMMPEGDFKRLMEANGQLVGLELFEQFFKADVHSALQSLKHIPLFHIHGDKDTRIIPTQADAYKQSRRNSTAVSRFMRLPQSDHEFSNRSEREAAIKATANWFEKTLVD